MTSHANASLVTIRPARGKDAPQIARLSGQLGYPTTAAEMQKRLVSVLRDRSGACFVAETTEHGVIGWLHVTVTPLLEVPRRAEVNGLVVDEQVRSRSTGWLLLQAAEKWARKMKCKCISVRSNIVRERAHAFYLRHEYEHYKTQKAFRKTL
jgi:ribosomal protein S18 acetylase RimI-like enzyme